MRYVNWIVVVCVLFPIFQMAAVAGNLDSPAAPTDPASAMYMMQDVYNRIDDGTEGTKRAVSISRKRLRLKIEEDLSLKQKFDGLVSDLSRIKI
jgi:hypothetical protein